jgi:hypothetical protein
MEELIRGIAVLGTLWRRLSDIFPQLDADCVQYVPVGSPSNNRVERMDWVIPEVTEEYWKKVMPRALPMNVDVVFNATVRRAVVYIRSPMLREFDVKSWSFIITNWWGG